MLPWQRGTLASGEQAKAIVEHLVERFERKQIRASRSQLDRQRNSVEPPAEPGDRRRVFVGELEAIVDCPRAIDEELDRAVLRSLGGRELMRRRCLRRAERGKPVSAFARQPERLAAGRQDSEARTSCEQTLRDARRLARDVFAVVKNQQKRLVFEVLDEAVEQRAVRHLSDAQR